MKKVIFAISFLVIFTGLTLAQQAAAEKKNPTGLWKFEAPYAPPEYTSGILTIGISEKNYTAELTFSGIEYKFPGEKVKFINDSLFFSIYVEGEVVQLSLKLEDASKMTGKAVYSDGVVPLTGIKEPEKK
jgi:hypothetical protein